MSKIIKLGTAAGKDCCDWIGLKDGTFSGDLKYCDLSQQCRQMGMRSDWYNFFDHEKGIYDFDYFCIGMYITEEDKGKDEEVS
jgi:hypothetical protein